MNYVGEVLSVTAKVRFYGACFTGGNAESICSESVRNVGSSSTVSVTTEGTRRTLGVDRVRREFSCDK